MKIFIFLFVLIRLFSQERNENLSSFKQINLSLNSNTKIFLTDRHSVKLEGHSKLLGDIDVFIKNETLTIKYHNDNENIPYKKSDLKISIYLKQLTHLSIVGTSTVILPKDINQQELFLSSTGSSSVSVFSGKIQKLTLETIGNNTLTISDVTSESIKLTSTGAGEIKFSGKTNLLDAKLIGPTMIKAFELNTNVLNAHIVGPGEIKITSSKKIDASFIGTGLVTYKGNEKNVNVKTSSIGNGKVVHQKD